MKTILISGCSYSLIYNDDKLQQELKNNFKIDKIINISESGCSIDRQIKAVVEWLSINDSPNLILLPITHTTRYDEPIAKNSTLLNDYNQSLCVSMDLFSNNIKMRERLDTKFEINFINDLIKIKTLIYNDLSSFNNFLTKIITFSGWLKTLNIRHLIFDMCNNFDEKKYLQIKKQKFLKNNKNIIDIFKFCGNDFIYKNISPNQLKNKNINYSMKNITHYDAEDNIELIKYLKSYTIVNNI
jgi:hypothetical protein